MRAEIRTTGARESTVSAGGSRVSRRAASSRQTSLMSSFSSWHVFIILLKLLADVRHTRRNRRVALMICTRCCVDSLGDPVQTRLSYQIDRPIRLLKLAMTARVSIFIRRQAFRSVRAPSERAHRTRLRNLITRRVPWQKERRCAVI